LLLLLLFPFCPGTQTLPLIGRIHVLVFWTVHAVQ
jgi:hypothetical protein